ncbi:MAG: hypothetical protein B7Y78_03670 [Caulobacter sp. 35-67-4]|nr:MAG: hypothetical protein B7Y78_03670 [Caulobacter sp. 35-67-4]
MFRMRLLGAKVVAVEAGSKTLRDAVGHFLHILGSDPNLLPWLHQNHAACHIVLWQRDDFPGARAMQI